MAMFFNRKKEEPVAPVIEPAVQAPEEPELPKEPVYSPMKKTIIGSGITFYGDFETSDPIELNGTIKGDINSDAAITIAEGAKYYGNANMNQLTVSGIIEGDIQCTDLSTFTSTAQMTGELRTAYLITDKGSNIHGNLSLEKPAPKAAAPVMEPESDWHRAEVFENPQEAETAPAEAQTEASNADVPLDEDGNPWNIDDYFKGPDSAEKLEKTDELHSAEADFEDRFAAIEKEAEALMRESDLDVTATDLHE